MLKRSTLLMIGPALWCATATGQSVEGREIVSPAVFMSSSSFSTPVTALIRFEIAPDWHLYWTNPGDAGLPVAVQWQLPDGFSVTELEYPTPQKIVADGITAYGYTNELVLLCTVTAPDAFTPDLDDRIVANLDWLVCKESCLRGGKTIAVDLGNLMKGVSVLSQDAVDRYRSRLPRSVSDLDLAPAAVVIDTSETRWRIELTLSGKDAKRIRDFYPHVLADFAIDFPSINVSESMITMMVEPYAPTARLERISGILMVDQRGFEIDVEVPVEAFR